jgi:hypothetical protein
LVTRIEQCRVSVDGDGVNNCPQGELPLFLP